MRVLPAGGRGVLVELAGLDEVMALDRGLRAAPVRGVMTAVPAATTLLVTFDPEVLALPALADALRSVPPVDAAGTWDDDEYGVVDVPVFYDGPDLSTVAERTGLTVDEVVRRHGAGVYRSAFCGFAPGFAYLTGLDERLRLPRLDTPRTRVPAGAVAIADEFAAVYPRESPGGWHLLGHTDLPMWDTDAEQPCRLAPGTLVRFVGAGR